MQVDYTIKSPKYQGLLLSDLAAFSIVTFGRQKCVCKVNHEKYYQTVRCSCKIIFTKCFVGIALTACLLVFN